MGDFTVKHDHLVGSRSYASVYSGSHWGLAVAGKLPSEASWLRRDSSGHRGSDVAARSIEALTEKMRVIPPSSTCEHRIAIWCIYAAQYFCIAIALELVGGQRLDFLIRDSDEARPLC